MTVVEFYDRNAIENVVSTLLCHPEQVVFVGDSKRRLNMAVENCRTIAEGRGLDVEFYTVTIGKNNLTEIVQTLTQLVEEFEQVTFDLTGGDELYLVAAGILYEYYGSERVQLHRFNIRNGTLSDCDADGNLMQSEAAEITVEENIRAYGGRLLFAPEVEQGTENWDFNYEFLRDIDAMWEICSEEPTRWNTQIHALGGMHQYLPEDAGLKFCIDLDEVAPELEKRGVKFVYYRDLFEKLRHSGLIRSLREENGVLSFQYKSEQVKRCLTKAGQALELYVTAVARETEVYNDVLCGAVIDWDGQEEEGSADTRNEIDVMLMKGLVPIFVSCKNGHVGIEELYKLNTVAERFGRRYSKKVLISTTLDKSKNSEYIRARAEDMGIRIIDDVDNMSRDKLSRAIRSLWSN